MKTLIAMFVLGAGLLQSSVTLAGNGTHEEHLVRICEALRQDDARKLRQEINGLYGIGVSQHQAYRLLARDLRCNGLDAISFALENRALESASLLARRSGVELNETQRQALAQGR